MKTLTAWCIVFIIGALVSAVCVACLCDMHYTAIGATRYMCKIGIASFIVIGYGFLIGIFSCVIQEIKHGR